MKNLLLITLTLLSFNFLFAQTESSGSLIMKNGFFIEGSIGGGYFGEAKDDFKLGGLGTKFGYKWYFGEGNFYRPGIQFTYLDLNMVYNVNAEFLGTLFSPANIGFSNLFEFTKDIGAEVNVNLGYNLFFDVINIRDADDLFHGFKINPEIKFRYKQLSVGFDAKFITNFVSSRSSLSTFPTSLYSFTIGRKF